MPEVTKAIVLIAGFGTRFLPLSKAVPKELWPLADLPMVHYIIDEIKQSGIKDIVFVVKPKDNGLTSYLKPDLQLEKMLKERKKANLLNEIKSFEDFLKNLNISFVVQRRPLGDGHAFLQAEKFAGGEPIACLFSDDIVDAKIPCLSQLIKIFKTAEKPVIALSKVEKERLSAYGVASGERITNRLYKIKKIIEKPTPEKAPSDLAIVGKYIFTPEVFTYLHKAKANERGEIILADALEAMLKDGKLIYGYEFEGRWLECGNKLQWLKSHLYFSLKHPQFGAELKKYIKDIT